jgi:Ca-activated chloride channel family protein
MSFGYPWVLLFLLIPAAILVWVWRRNSHRLMMPFDYGTQGRGRLLGFLLALAESIPPLVMAAVIVLLANPQQLSLPRTKRVLTNIEFAVDISGSMTAGFGDGTRYDASMEAINEFIDYREGDAFGLTFFGNNVMHWVPLTTDSSAFKCAPPFMDPNKTYIRGFGGTEIGKALRACRDVLIQREEGDRMIVLVSDGFSSDLGGGNDLQIIDSMNKNRIKVNAIHIAESTVPDPVVNITAMTGGEVYSPGDVEGLKSVFMRIDEMQQTRLEKIAAEVMDDFTPTCIVGLSLLGLCLSTLFGLRYTPW